MLPAWLTFSLDATLTVNVADALSICKKGSNLVVLGAQGHIKLVDRTGAVVETPPQITVLGGTFGSCQWRESAQRLLIGSNEGAVVSQLVWGATDAETGFIPKDPENPEGFVIDLYGLHESTTDFRIVDSSLSRMYVYTSLPTGTIELPDVIADSVITLPDSAGEVSGNFTPYGPGWLMGRTAGAANGTTHISYFNRDFTQRTDIPVPVVAAANLIGVEVINGEVFLLPSLTTTIYRLTPGATAPESNMESETLKPDDTIDSNQVTSDSGTPHAALQADDANKVHLAPDDSYLYVSLEETTAPADAAITLTIALTDSVITSPLANPLTIFLQSYDGGITHDTWVIVPGTNAGTLLHAVPGTFLKVDVDDMRIGLDGAGDVTAAIDAIGLIASWASTPTAPSNTTGPASRRARPREVGLRRRGRRL